MVASDETKKDAKERTNRSLWQNIGGGFVSVVLVAGAGAVTDTLSAGQAVDWPILGAAVGTAVLGAVAAYAQRRYEGSRKDRPRT